MKYLQNFKLFRESDYDWSKNDAGEEFYDLPNSFKDWLDKCTKGSWSQDPKSKLINVEGDFDCSFQRLKVIPHGLKFGKVSGSFYAFGNDFEDLTGFPFFVKKKFNVDDNPLENYTWSPFSVGWSFKSKDIDKRGKDWNAKDVLVESKTASGTLKLALETSSFLNPDCWNKLFEFYPAEGIHIIAPVWNWPDFAPIKAKINLPGGFDDELELFSGFSDLGIF